MPWPLSFLLRKRGDARVPLLLTNQRPVWLPRPLWLLKPWWFLYRCTLRALGYSTATDDDPAAAGQIAEEGGLQREPALLLAPPLPPPDASPLDIAEGGWLLIDRPEGDPRASPRGDGEVRSQRTAWVSLDPVRGRLDVYPRAVSARIETAFERGEATVELGCFGASVHFDAEGAGCHLQRTAGGRRDVFRFTFAQDDETEVVVPVHRPGRAWRVLHALDDGGHPPPGAEVRTVAAGRDILDPTLPDQVHEPSLSSTAPAVEATAAASSGATGGDAVSSGLSTVNASHEAERWALWVSIDPRTGRVMPYPAEVARQLEVAQNRGESTVTLGAAFFNATVHMEDRPYQRTARGRRDVRRLLLARPGVSATVRVALGPRGWRSADSAELSGTEPEATEEHAVATSSDVLVDLALAESADPAAEISASSPPRPSAPELALFEGGAATGGNPSAASPADASAGTAGGGALEALWEWCRRDGQHAAAAHTLSAEAWGVYSREQNSDIEAAFQAGRSDAEVSVGIRTYRVVFGPEAGFARQVDEVLHKRRLVRRRLVSHEESSRALDPVAPQVARDQESCPICCANFAESAAMPVLELPGCQHVFHTACAQQLADSASPCPCCRADVDWVALGLAARHHRRSRG
uniref:RING-type domain-containing protein n=1 Tax=Alexandrium monilatum TaxID=311494 RepID=A0A7S4RB00_9DINO